QRMLTMDGLLALWVVVALAAAHAALAGGGLRRGWWAASALACGLGLLTKGPVALALVLPPVLAYRMLGPGCAGVAGGGGGLCASDVAGGGSVPGPGVWGGAAVVRRGGEPGAGLRGVFLLDAQRAAVRGAVRSPGAGVVLPAGAALRHAPLGTPAAGAGALSG